jgi:predicted nucleotide-binding protein (sugar kinase/HSP70/actin superfamily)
MYYKLFPLWQTFFQELGIEVITSNGAMQRVTNIPFMPLAFDEHTTAKGLKTRLESFLDFIAQRKGHAG